MGFFTICVVDYGRKAYQLNIQLNIFACHHMNGKKKCIDTDTLRLVVNHLSISLQTESGFNSPLFSIL